ncbi:hypothetical protein H4582DRAFT_336044 [Lactarius indigo]|nr:hypothetical protein H4582DRAFT_336044 [Lactarius indigo]
MSDDPSLFLPFEGVNPALPSFRPPQGHLEAFYKDLDLLDNPDLDSQFPTLDDLSYAFHNSTPLPGLALPSKFTRTTESSEGPATSDYFSTNYSTSNHPAHLDFGSQLRAVDPMRTIFSTPSSFLDSSGPQFSPTLVPGVYVAEAQSDDVPYRQPVGMSPYILPTAFQSPPPPYPTDSPVCAASESAKQSHTGPIRVEHTCPDCSRVFDRKSNLNSHKETHNPNRKRPYVCPESGCGKTFIRSNDRKRHVQSQHGDQVK